MTQGVVLVQHSHLRDLGYCNRGSRDFFNRHGLDWAAFVENGIDAEHLRATGDAMALAAVEMAERLHDGR
jgi:hypothetical protein